MKKLFIVALAMSVLAVSNVMGQDYKKFKFGTGMLYAVPTGEGAGGGIGFYMEPKLNLNNKFDVGFLMEWALMVQNIEGTSSSISGCSTYSLTGDYMMGKGKIRPFVGTGLGFYRLGSVDVTVEGQSVTNGDVDLGSKFGFSPRIGINFSHFQMMLQYHAIMGQESLINKNYLGIKIGVEFGGGLKK
jgi:outer membrane protein X